MCVSFWTAYVNVGYHFRGGIILNKKTLDTQLRLNSVAPSPIPSGRGFWILGPALIAHHPGPGQGLPRGWGCTPPSQPSPWD